MAINALGQAQRTFVARFRADTTQLRAGGVTAGKIMRTALIGVGVGAGLAVAGLGKVGAEFDAMRDTIIVGTGASGKALKGLERSAKNVGKTTPSSFKDIGTAVADVNTRLGLTGKPLEQVTRQFLNMSRITGTDLQGNIKETSRVFGDWGISIKNQSGALDELFLASQATGIEVQALSRGLVQYGAPLRQLGFSFRQSTALIAKFEKEGVNTQLVLGSMRIALGKMAREGEKPVATFRRVAAQIKNTGDVGKANALALELFGARAGPDMAAAIREGRFEIDGLVKQLGGAEGAINDADKRTRDFAENWKIFGNNLKLYVEPIAARVFELLNRAMAWLATHGVPALKAFVERIRDMAGWLDRNQGLVKGVAVALGALVVITKLHTAAMKVQAAGGFLAFLGNYLKSTRLVQAATKTWTAMQWLLNAALTANPIGLVIAAAAALAVGIVILWRRSETFRKVATGAFNAVWGAIKAMWDWTKRNWPLLLTILTGPIGLAVVAIVKNWRRIRETGQNLWNGLREIWRTGVRFVVNVFLDMVDRVLTGAAKAFGWVPKLGDKLKKARDEFKGFRKGVNAQLANIKDKNIKISGQADISTGKRAVYVNGVQVVGGRFAQGGLWNHENHVAQLARGGAWRVWAEDETGGEAYIPLAPGKRNRSLKVLETVAHMFGYKLLQAADGAVFNVNTDLPLKPWKTIATAFNKDANALGLALAYLKAAGSGFSPGLSGALNWARSQAGKPYLWGGVGPSGYDCSGFQSAIVNIIQGKHPYTRRFATASLPAGLFSPGIGPYMVGWFTGNPGHMAGTLNGVNVESAGGVGVRVGSRARGARDGSFGGPWRLRGLNFDHGGPLPPGISVLDNRTGRTEHLVNRDDMAPKVEVRVFVGDQEIRDIVRVEVQRKDDQDGADLYARGLMP